MANLYLARFTGVGGFEKLVAIKQVHRYLADQAEFIQMFIDEARIASRIAHPNVVQVLELGEDEGGHYMAMEYVAGENLTAILKRGPIPERIAVQIAASASAGLHAAHELRSRTGELLGVVHRDVSPQNILVSYEGAAKVTDFGIARAKDNLHVTTEGVVKGKFSYMAPEHARGEAIDRRADVFALGVVLYEITTGRRVFQGETDVDVVNRVLRGEVTPPSEIAPGYSLDLEAIVMQALAPSLAHRFQTAEELQLALESYLSSSGPPLLGSAVAGHLQAVFADRIEEKRAILRQLEADELLESTPTPATPSGQRPLPEGARPRGSAFAILLATLLLCGGVIGGALWLKARRAGRAEPRAPSAIVIAVEATPPEATITIDGRRVRNPVRESHPPRSGTALVRVTAPAHLPQEYEVPLASGCNLSIALARQPASASPATTPDARAAPPPVKLQPRKRTRRPKEDDLFGDPYGR
jgi:serine/threonine-protein kinase